MSGYIDCACRDCFQGPIVGEPGDLCDGCEEAGCVPWPGEEFEVRGTRYECSNPHAYGGIDGTGHCGDEDCCGPAAKEE